MLELRHLVHLPRAQQECAGDDLVAEQKIEEALKEYAEAARLAPEIEELPFWQAVTLASVGREAEAAPIFRDVFQKNPVWAELVGRLPASKILPDDPALIARIRALAPRR